MSLMGGPALWHQRQCGCTLSTALLAVLCVLATPGLCSLWGILPPGFLCVLPPVAVANAATMLDSVLIAEGRRLFFTETFNGNGRTCGTCHRAERSFTIDPEFIKTLPATDPLFVAEFTPCLPSLRIPCYSASGGSSWSMRTDSTRTRSFVPRHR